MGGGLLNFMVEGNKDNKILNGNPSKTFFKSTYSKFSNFGMQKFRIDFEGLRTLRLTEDSIFTFPVPRYGDLLMDTYFVMQLPNIYSPIVEQYPNIPTDTSTNIYDNPDNVISSTIIKNPITRNYYPYEFKWIENLGCQMIKKIRYMIGGQVIQEFTGQYLYSMVQRDFSESKKEIFERMIGNTVELTDPGNYGGRTKTYPNAVYNSKWTSDTTINGPEPSIRGRKIYVPLNVQSTLQSKLAIPLVSLQYELLSIEITCRPIQELFVVRYIPERDIAVKWNELSNRFSYSYDTPKYILQPDLEKLISETSEIGNYVQPDQTYEKYAFYRFLNPPISPNVDLSSVNLLYLDSSGRIVDFSINVTDDREIRGTIDLNDINNYTTKNTDWFADIHLISTYVFLEEEQRRQFAAKPQNYLIKEVYETTYYNKFGETLIDLNSNSLVSSWMWFLQRTDVNLRNEWSNYSNWDYKDIPFPAITSIIETYKENYIPQSMYKLSSYLVDNFATPATFQNTVYKNFLLDVVKLGDASYSDLSLNNLPSKNDISYNKIAIEFVKARYNGQAVVQNLKLNFGNLPNPYLISGPFHVENKKEIMLNWALILNGKFREVELDAGVNNYIEKYVRTAGNGKDGLYCYNFCLNTNPFEYQPSGAMNLTKFNQIQFQFTTIFPPQQKNLYYSEILDNCGNIIAVQKPSWSLNKYNYNLHLMEERYNVLSFMSGTASLQFAR